MRLAGVFGLLFGVSLYLSAWQRYADGKRDEMWLALIGGTGFLLVAIIDFAGGTSLLVFSLASLIVIGMYFHWKVRLKKSSPNWWKWYRDQP